MSVFHSSFENNDLHAYLPGDIMIGGLFPIHLQTNRTISPGPVSCEKFNIQMFLCSQVMIYTIQEINQRTPRLLPNLTLGYNIYDTCGDVSLAIRAALQLLKNQSDPQRCLIPASINSSLPEPETKVVIGERFSEMSIAVARILALSSVTQISYASTSEQLSIKYKFPTFLRTVSSDKHQTKAIYELVKNFSWQSVAIVGSTDEYGKYDAFCKSCEKYQYSPKANRSTCVTKIEEFLEWSDPFSIILTTVAGFAIIVTVVIATIIGINCGTPIVKAIGGCFCFLEVASLLLGFSITFTFIGRPTENSCLGIPLFGISFSLCISCILANLIQILVGFSFDPRVGSKIKRLNHPVAVVIIISGVQIGISLAWLIVLPRSPVEELKTTTILYQCDMSEPSKKFFAATVVYNSFWGLVCFIFAFKGRQLPDIYKNASLITVSMVLFLIIWIVFLPIFLTLKGKYKPAISSAAILISCLSILGCHLAPKCYIMLFRKEINNQNAISEYIRKHYERKNLPVIS
ncbi:G-protein coupled receptor family C group 6 member A-like [Anableps anableps]